MNNQPGELPSMMVDHDYLSGKTEKPRHLMDKGIEAKRLLAEALQEASAEDGEYLQLAMRALDQGNLEQASACIAVSTSLDKQTRKRLADAVKELRN